MTTAIKQHVQLGNLDPLYTEVEAAEYLRVGRRFLSVDRCEGRHRIPYVKVGRLVRYRQSALDAFLQKQTKE